MRYSDMLTFVTAGLAGLGYDTANHPAMPAFNPGPPSLPALWKSVSPNAVVFLTVGNGLGPTVETVYDRPFVVVRVIGPQGNDYTTAETLAYDIDNLLLAVQTQNVGSARTLYFTRNAAPQLVDLDDSDRYHFQTTYITETKR
jgi:hypothetical protein